MNQLDELGKKICNIRIYKKISQSNLAKKANLSQSFISHVEQGIRNPTINSLKKIAEGLNIPFSEFLLYITGDVNFKKKEAHNGTMDKINNNFERELKNIGQKIEKYKTIITKSIELDKKIIKNFEEKYREDKLDESKFT